MLLAGYPCGVNWYEWHALDCRDFCDLGQQASLYAQKKTSGYKEVFNIMKLWDLFKISYILADLSHILDPYPKVNKKTEKNTAFQWFRL